MGLSPVHKEHGIRRQAASARYFADSGHRLVAHAIPELHQLNDDYPFTAAHEKIKDTVAPEQVPVLDLIDGLRNRVPEVTLWVTPLDDHPNGKAKALIAAQLRDAILMDLAR